jgi:hypothetical protein
VVVGRRLARLAVLFGLAAALMAFEPAAVEPTLQGSLPPLAVAYVGGLPGREVPVYPKPRFRDLPIGYFPEGTRLELRSSVIKSDGHKWVRVRVPSGHEVWALTRTLKPNPPFQESGRRSEYPTYLGGARWAGPIRFCVNPAGMPSSFSEPQFVDAVDRAVRLWQSAAGGGIPIENQGRCERDAKNHRDGFSVIGWGRPKEGSKMLLGASYTRASGGRIVESDVVLDAVLLGRRPLTPIWVAERGASACLAQTLAHEIGHLIGLEHAPEDVVSVMRPEGSCLRISKLPNADVVNVGRLY